jgi:hypothetical protein
VRAASNALSDYVDVRQSPVRRWLVLAHACRATQIGHLATCRVREEWARRQTRRAATSGETPTPTTSPSTSTVFAAVRTDVTHSSTITIRMATRIWQGIDAEMDNVSQAAYQEGHDSGGDYALAVREAGWTAVGGPGNSWPPDDDPIAVTLDRSQWAIVVKSIQASDPIYVRLGDHESVQVGRRALQVIEPRL